MLLTLCRDIALEQNIKFTVNLNQLIRHSQNQLPDHEQDFLDTVLGAFENQDPLQLQKGKLDTIQKQLFHAALQYAISKDSVKDVNQLTIFSKERYFDLIINDKILFNIVQNK